MRRSLTVTPENDKKILLTKGLFLTGDDPFDIDYTTLVNIFLELGHKVMASALNEPNNPTFTMTKNEVFEVFKKYAFSNELKEDAVGDQFAEIVIRKLIEQYNKSVTQALKQPQNPELSPQPPQEEQQPDAAQTETKHQVYIR